MDPQTGIYCDTNVFIALRELPSSDPIRLALEDLFALSSDDGRPFLKTSLLTTAELLVHPFKNLDIELEIFYRGISVTNSFLEIGPLTHEVMLNAAQLRASNSAISLPDALHLATGLAFGCRYFLTADKRLLRDYQIDLRHSHPFYAGLTNGSATILGVELTVKTVSELISEIKK